MIDPRAVITAGARVAADAEVGPFAVIGAHVVIGPRTWIGPHALIVGHTTVGEDNKIFQFASIGEAPQDKKYGGEPTRLVIGDRNVIREYCTISRGTTLDQGVTRIGSDNLFMAYTHVAHDCVIGDNVIMVNLAMIAGHVQVGDWAILSGYCAVHQHCKIGAHAFLANNCGVTRDVPPYVMAVGQSGGAAFDQQRRSQAPWLLRRPDPQSAQCLPGPLPQRPAAGRGSRAARCAGGRPAGTQAAAGFHPDLRAQSDPLMG